MKVCLLAVALFVAVGSLSGCGMINSIRAKAAVNDGAKAYGAGKYVDAQKQFERALELDPDQKNAALFRARALYAQYRNNDDSPKNVEIARKAIQAYQDIYQKDPTNDEAFNAIGALYGKLKEDEKQRDWISKRANDTSIPPEKRSDAYAVLARKDWNCSTQITELKENQQTVNKGDKAIIEYKKPKEQKDYDAAQQCATRGLELANQAISLNANSEPAWRAKAGLLREEAKLAQMDGKNDQKENFNKQADDAQKKADELYKIDEERKKREAEEKAKKEKKS